MTLDPLVPILHKIHVKLYPNNFSNVQGAYIARTTNDKVLSVEDICTNAKTRGGVTGSFEDMVEHVRHFLAEMVYQLLDGFGVDTGYFTARANIGGSFNSPAEPHDHDKQRISLRFSIRGALRKLLRDVEVVVEGVADTSGHIDSYLDYEEHAENSIFLPGNMFAIHGHKIKIAGEDPSCGVYFVPVDDPSRAVKLSRIAENTATTITGIAPNTNYINNRIEIRTQYTGSGSSALKTPRTIVSPFVLEQC